LAQSAARPAKRSRIAAAVGFGGLCERREPAQVAEDRGHLAPVPGEEFLALLAREQVGRLRREARELGALPLDRAEQPHVLDRDHDLIGERLDQPDLAVAERARLVAGHDDRPPLGDVDPPAHQLLVRGREARERDDAVDVAVVPRDVAVVRVAETNRTVDDGLQHRVESKVVRAIVWITSRTAASRSPAASSSRPSSAGSSTLRFSRSAG
jgi:hypothetical protein